MTAPVNLIDRTFLSGVAKAVYSVKTEGAGTAFMCVSRGNHRSEERTVVVADAARFLAAWRTHAAPARVKALSCRIRIALNLPRPKSFAWNELLPFLAATEWRRDHKFDDAASGFGTGIANPVPLATVGLSVHAAIAGVAIGDGITRTLWLLANGAPAFPIECSTSTANAMNRLVGVSWGHPATVRELLGDLSWADWLQRSEVPRD